MQEDWRVVFLAAGKHLSDADKKTFSSVIFGPNILCIFQQMQGRVSCLLLCNYLVLITSTVVHSAP